MPLRPGQHCGVMLQTMERLMPKSPNSGGFAESLGKAAAEVIIEIEKALRISG